MSDMDMSLLDRNHEQEETVETLQAKVRDLEQRLAEAVDAATALNNRNVEEVEEARRERDDLQRALTVAPPIGNWSAQSMQCDDLEVALAAEREELRGLLNRMVTERDIAEQKVERVEALPDKWDMDVRRGTSAKDMGWRGMSIGEGFNACADDLRAALREDTTGASKP